MTVIIKYNDLHKKFGGVKDEERLENIERIYEKEMGAHNTPYIRFCYKGGGAMLVDKDKIENIRFE